MNSEPNREMILHGVESTKEESQDDSPSSLVVRQHPLLYIILYIPFLTMEIKMVLIGKPLIHSIIT